MRQEVTVPLKRALQDQSSNKQTQNGHDAQDNGMEEVMPQPKSVYSFSSYVVVQRR